MTRLAAPKAINTLGVATPVTPSDVWLMDGNITDGQLTIPLINASNLSNLAVTDNNAGLANAPDISMNLAVNTTGTANFILSEYFKQVTSFLSVNSNPPLNNSGLLADDSGDSPVAKGCKILGIELTYQIIGTNSLTSFGVHAATVNYGAAGGTSTDLFPSANLTAAQIAITGASGGAGQPMRVTTLAMASPIFDFLDNTTAYMKISVVTAGSSCTFRLYNVALNLAFNFN